VAKPRLNIAVLDGDKLRVIRLQAEIAAADQFFLAGGTGLALRLDHRLSDDLDWFTAKRFSVPDLERKLGQLTEKPTSVRQHGAQTLRAYYGELETSFIAYRQVPARPEIVKVGDVEIALADMDILAAMKAAALHDRGARRDFIDVHAISSEGGWSVRKFIEHAGRMLPLQPEQVARALTYFVDAEKEPMPKGCKVSWEKVKADLMKGVRQWERNREIDR
jgi:hypothetical protein